MGSRCPCPAFLGRQVSCRSSNPTCPRKNGKPCSAVLRRLGTPWPVRKDGKGHLENVDDLVTVKPGPTSVVGKSVIFHEQRDDLKTQPAGNSGAGKLAHLRPPHQE